MDSQSVSRRKFLAAASMGGLMLASRTASANTYPSRPIKLIVPWAPGASGDLSARVMQPKLEGLLRGNIVVENRAGAAGQMGTLNVVRSAPDGYSILWGNSSTHGLSKRIAAELPYDPITDTTPISLLFRTVFCVVAHPSAPFNTFDGLVKYAKTRPGEVAYGSAGPKSAQQMIGELIKLGAGIDLNHVPYKGSGPSVNDLIAGHIPVVIASLSSVTEYHAKGTARILAVTTPQRSPELPNVPAVAETIPGFAVTGWGGAFGPKGMPADIVSAWNAAIGTVIADPDVKKAFVAAGMVPEASKPAELQAIVENASKTWDRLLDAGVKF